MIQANISIGDLVCSSRERRHLSQLDLAAEVDISQKHLSFIGSRRTTPSREMVLCRAGHLEVPLRERNTMLLAAGFAPVYRDRSLSDPDLAQAMDLIERLIKAHEPYPALTLDRHWHAVSANAAAPATLRRRSRAHDAACQFTEDE